MAKHYDPYEEGYLEEELEDISEVKEEEEGLLTFKSFLVNHNDLLDEKNRKILSKNKNHIYVLYDIYKDDYFDYCAENGFESELLEEE